MPAIKLNDQQFALRTGQTRLGTSADADVRIASTGAPGIRAIVDVAGNHAVIRRAGESSAVRVNGVPLVDPTPLMHGDKVEIDGQALYYADDTKSGATQQMSARAIAALAPKRTPPLATAATGGRLVSLVDGKEYAIPATGITLGRDAGAGVVVAQNEVSRKHAEIVPGPDGYVLTDFSANGVFVNGLRVTREQRLSRSDVIRVGTEEFRFYADPSPAMRTPAVAMTPAVPVVPAPPAAAAAVSAPPPLAILEITNEGPTKGQQYPIRVPLAHIGRGAHNDVPITDDSVSDTHAKLQRRADGWYLSDVGSTNGTYIGGTRITGERRLDGAPDVRVGGVKMIFRVQDAPGDPARSTRAIASVDRAKLRKKVAGPATDVAAATAPAAEAPTGGIGGWVWLVVALAVIAVVALLTLNH
jgi:pSer/pThr/pTyr-binding forkhead associated (FHA) protein